jgi:hypothetical protein
MKKLASNVPHFYISKPFFKTCLYKLEYTFRDTAVKSPPTSNYWGYSSSSSYAEARRALWSKAQAFSRGVKRFAKSKDFDVRVRTENGSVSVFLKTEADALAVIAKYKPNLSGVWVPFNDTQVEMIGEDLNATLIFRKSLFGSSNVNPGYRYKVQCHITPDVLKSWEAINEMVSKLDEADFKANDNWAKVVTHNLRYWNTFSMYFNDEQDIMMLKLMLGSKDFKLQKAVLYSELE